MLVIGSNGTKTLEELRVFCALHLGQRHDAPTNEDDEKNYKLYSKEFGNEVHKLHIEEDALHDAWRAEEDLKLYELMQAKEWTPSNPTPPKDLGGAGGYSHNAATTNTGESSEAEETGAVARNKEGAAPSNKFKNSHFQPLRPRFGAQSGFQHGHCEPLVPRPMAVD